MPICVTIVATHNKTIATSIYLFLFIMILSIPIFFPSNSNENIL